MNLRYGLLSEGDSDLKTLTLIIDRLAKEIGVSMEISQEQSNPVAGPISKLSVRLRTSAFIDNGIDVGFYFADNDKGETQKRRMIIDNIRTIRQTWLERSVIGIPNPHMESWLLKDEDTIKNYFDIPSSESLPFPDEKPKNRMSALVSTYGKDELTVGEFRHFLANSMDIDIVLRRSTDFSTFVRDFRRVINCIDAQQDT